MYMFLLMLDMFIWEWGLPHYLIHSMHNKSKYLIIDFYSDRISCSYNHEAYRIFEAGPDWKLMDRK